ncbi:MAG TPA: hypothetical protein VFO40_18650 [Chthoniobacterales bacterium]|nr:hypothetical protein [Chthoniobacterales bacterium]
MAYLNTIQVRCQICGVFTLVCALFLAELLVVDSGSHPTSTQEWPRQPGATETELRSTLSRPTRPGLISGAAPLGVPTLPPLRIAILGDQRRLDDVLQSGHASAVSALAFGPDGKWLTVIGLITNGQSMKVVDRS